MTGNFNDIATGLANARAVEPAAGEGAGIALAAAVSLLFWMNAGGVAGLLLLYAPFHMYRQIRGTYLSSRFGALWRMLVLSVFA